MKIQEHWRAYHAYLDNVDVIQETFFVLELFSEVCVFTYKLIAYSQTFFHTCDVYMDT